MSEPKREIGFDEKLKAALLFEYIHNREFAGAFHKLMSDKTQEFMNEALAPYAKEIEENETHSRD